jgi:RNA polymerase sigma-70 factor (ECF subfamily)
VDCCFVYLQRFGVALKCRLRDKEDALNTIEIKLNERDETRFNELMNLSYKKVYNMAYRLAGNRPDAEDLTQDAFYRAYRSFGEYEGDRPFENWIFRIVTRLFLDLLRNRRRRVRAVSYDTPLTRDGGDENLYFDMADGSPNPEQKVLEGSFSEELQRALNSLSPEQRLLVTLADVEGVPYKEIAEMLGKPVGTIRSRLHRTHKLIRTRLDQIRREQSIGGRSSVSRLALAFS